MVKRKDVAKNLNAKLCLYVNLFRPGEIKIADIKHVLIMQVIANINNPASLLSNEWICFRMALINKAEKNVSGA